MRERESDVTATLDCNNDCSFCPREELRSILVPDEDLLEALEAGLTDVAVSIYSLRPESHDGITRVKGSCLQSWLGLARALAASRRRRRLRVRVNVVLSSSNIADAQETLRRLGRPLAAGPMRARRSPEAGASPLPPGRSMP